MRQRSRMYRIQELKDKLKSTEVFKTYRGTSLIRNRLPIRPYISPISRALWWS